ncbi:hypothetical protein ACTXT7_006836 [Hymenolepis weldensis]
MAVSAHIGSTMNNENLGPPPFVYLPCVVRMSSKLELVEADAFMHRSEINQREVPENWQDDHFLDSIDF